MRARRIPRDKLPETVGESWVDTSKSPFVEGDIAWVPVLPGESCDREIPAKRAYAGRGYYLLGDIAIVHGRKPGPEEIKRIVGYCKPRGVVWRESLRDVTRTPHVEIVWGDCGEVRHRESGYTFILDPSKVMFSQGNRTEKSRMAGLIRSSGKEERVADMFAGIGYFTIPMAGAGARVHAMEINPVACKYLQRNALENRLAERITVSPGDCRDNLSGTYDRIVMGHFDAPTMLENALCHAKRDSIIHVHAIGPATAEIQKVVEGTGFSCGIMVHKVKKYGPHAWHVVHDVTIL